MALSETSKASLTSLMAAVALSACGGGGSDDNSTPPAPTPIASYGIGGEVAGLGSGKSLVLQNNGGNDLTQANNGGFEFSTKVEAGKPYNVTVAVQPQFQTCSVANGSGTASATVTDIKVECVDEPVSTDTSQSCFTYTFPYTKGHVWTYTMDEGATRSYEATGDFVFQGDNVQRVRELTNGQFSQASYVHTASGAHYLNGTSRGVTSGNLPREGIVAYTPPLATPASIPFNRPYTGRYTRSGKLGDIEVSTTSIVQTIAYQGRETIQTAFGSFETCKMQYSLQEDGGPPKVNTDWVIAGGKFTGLVAQSQADGKTTQPSKIEVNWN